MRKDLTDQNYEELFEGFLLKAKNMYEEKKIPYLANLFSVAPFTNTPLVNINQSLIFAEQLSYRQLILLALIYENSWTHHMELSKNCFQDEQIKSVDELSEGIYYDIYHMVSLGLVGQESVSSENLMILNAVGFVVPDSLTLLIREDYSFMGCSCLRLLWMNLKK